MVAPMNPVDLRLVMAILWRSGLLIAVVGTSAVVIGGVEGSRAVVAGELTGAEWWLRAMTTAVSVSVDVLPVILAVAVVMAVGRWFDSGRALALDASGWPATRWPVVAGVAGAMVVLTGVLLVEATAPITSARISEQAWVLVQSPDPDGADADEVAIKATRVTGDTAIDVKAAWFRSGELVAVGHVEQAVWTGQRWSMRGRNVRRLPNLIEARTVLPHPDQWAAGRTGATDRASLTQLLRFDGSTAATAWAWKRVLGPLLGFALAAICVLVVPAGRSRVALGAGLGLLTGVAWAAFWSSVARGSVPWWLAVGLVLGGCLIAVVGARGALGRRGLATAPWPALTLLG